jgi:NAD(P)-dependent dehydrogenase (short-subunit alcohol dehydrogenase family)
VSDRQSTPRRIALVTGANRGLGFEAARQLGRRGLLVLLGCRDSKRGEAAAVELRREHLDVQCIQIDVADPALVAALAERLERQYGRLDVLVNNAGILPDRGWPVVKENLPEASAFAASLPTLLLAIETNALGAFLMCQACIPLMQRHGCGRVVNVSTTMGQLTTMGGGWPAYRLSKAALNAVTRVFAAETAGTGVLVNSVNPGWVRTEMGGPDAPLSLQEGADSIVWAATLPDHGPSGQFLQNREAIPW